MNIGIINVFRYYKKQKLINLNNYHCFFSVILNYSKKIKKIHHALNIHELFSFLKQKFFFAFSISGIKTN